MRARRRGILLVVSAPSGGGKTTLVKSAMASDPALQLSVSCTTRQPREGEVDGVDYRFVSQATFRDFLAEGEFVESAEVFDHAYATPRSALDVAIAEGRDILLDVDIQGARSLKRAYPKDAVGIFVMPPSAAALESRLRARGTDDDAQIARRLARVREEITAAREVGVYDYLIVNDDREKAANELLSIIRAESCRQGRLAPPELE